MVALIADQQPELVGRIEAARAAVESFREWLVDNRPSMTADAGVGKAAFDWYLKYVKLMPWTADELAEYYRDKETFPIHRPQMTPTFKRGS